MLTVAATFHMSAQGSCPARLDGAHHSQLLKWYAVARAKARTVAAEDVGHFEGWPVQSPNSLFRVASFWAVRAF